MSKRANPALVGAFVLGAITIAAATIVTFGAGRWFRHTQDFVLYFQGSVNGLDTGAPVKFRGVPIGTVTDIRLALSAPRREPRVPVLIEIDQDRLVQLGASPDFVSTPLTMVQRMQDAGLRAQLQQQSLITGLLYVDLDLFPGSPKDLVLPAGSGPYPEIATLPTRFERAQAKIEEIFERVSRIDFEAVGKSLSGTIDGMNRLVNSPDVESTLVTLRETLTEIRKTTAELRSGTRPLVANVNGTTTDLRTTVQRLQATLDRLDALVDPRAPLVAGMTGALADVGEAARAVRQLAEHLDRDPSVLLTGKKAP